MAKPHVPKQPENRDASVVDALLQKAVAHHQAGQLAQAEALYRRILQLTPNHPDALHLLGVMASQVGKYSLALELIDQSIRFNPRNANAHSNRGNALYELHQYQAALESFDKAIQLMPNSADAYNNRGNALNGLQQYQAALASCTQAIQLKPEYAEAHSNRGRALSGLQQHQDALESCVTALRLSPDLAEAHINRGIALLGLAQYQAALECFDKALRLKPNDAIAHNNRGMVFNDLKQSQAALDSFNRAIQLNSEFAEAYNNRGCVLNEIQQYRAALDHCNEAIRLKPEYAEAYNNQARALIGLEQYPAALESCDKAILLKPDFAEAHCNRGNALQEMEQYQAALESINRAIILRSDYHYLHGMQMHLKQTLCDWEDYESHCRQLETEIETHAISASPFFTLTMLDSPALQRKAAEIYVSDKFPLRHNPAALAPWPKHDRIRIGYYSADFHDHATCHLMGDLFEQHDRSKFEVFAFSFGPAVQDAMKERVSASMDRFLDVSQMLDEDVAQLSRDLQIDIAVDLKGFTKDSRPGIFAQRAAPLQVSYVGYPGTMSASFMDYLVADPTLIPEASRRHYSEKIIYLPHSYQPNSRRPISALSCTRSEQGLPEQGFVFCCFNNNYKITPNIFDIWMRILGQVEGSVLWLLEDNPWAGENLRRHAARGGIAPERLVFAPRQPLPLHLARHRLADLFLDTLPCNAHTTASDALYAGLPVLTCMGAAFASRVAASLLRAVDLPELVTTTEASYQSLAIEVALDARRSLALSERLQQGLPTAPLFDTRSYTGHIEAAYSSMYRRHQMGLPPDHIHLGR